MKFTLIKDLKEDRTMKPILTGLLAFILLYLLSDIIVKYLNFGIFASDVHLTLFGNEEQYIDPLSKASFLEFWHMEIFFIMMLLLTLSAVYIRLANNSSYQLIVLNVVMLSAIVSLISIIVSYFFSASFVNVYMISFLTWHIVALYMVFFSLWKLYRD